MLAKEAQTVQFTNKMKKSYDDMITLPYDLIELIEIWSKLPNHIESAINYSGITQIDG